MDCNRAYKIFSGHPGYIVKPLEKNQSILSFLRTLMATNTTFRVRPSRTESVQKRLNDYRNESLEKGTYLAAPTKQLMWYTVAATKASYLICADEAASSSEEADSAFRPPPAELVMILKVFSLLSTLS